TPPRDLVLAFTADEEAGSDYGARYLIREHRELFDGCTEAIGEVGGFSYTVSPDLRLYLMQTAEKGIDWLRLTARGRPGHGSLVHDDNAVTALCEAVARLGRHRFPIELTPTVRAFLEHIAELLGVELDPDDPEAADGPLVDSMAAALRAEDAGARPIPYMLSGGTDAKAWSEIGIRCFGFTPLRLPPDLNFAALFHGIDERVPVEGLQFGVRVLDRFL